MKALLIILLCLPAVVCAQKNQPPPLATSSKSAWHDTRLLEWNRLILDNKAMDALAAVEKDLASVKPHFAARFYWYKLTKIFETTDQRLKDFNGSDAGKHLDVSIEIFRAYDEERHYEITQEYPNANRVDDPLALLQLQWASENSESQLAYGVKALELQPELFVCVWNIIELVQADFRLNDRVRELFTHGKFKSNPFAAFVLYELDHFPLEAGIDRLEFADRLITDGQDTPWLAKFRAQSLFSQYRFREAFEAYQKASEMLPVFPVNVNAAKCLIRDQKYLEARNFTRRWAEITTKDTATAEERTEAWLASALRLAGEHGRARDILKPHNLLNEQPWWRLADRESVKPLEIKAGALSRWPNSPDLSEQMAELEMADGRLEEALQYAKSFFALMPNSQEAFVLYLKCLRQGGVANGDEEAIELWDNHKSRLGVPSKALFHQVFNSYLAVDDVESALDISEVAVGRYQDSTWMLANLGIAYEADEELLDAASMYQQAIAINPSYQYGIDHLHDTLSKLPQDQGGGEVAANERIMQHRDKHPWLKYVWQMLASESNSESDKLAIWRQAQQLNPNEAWPWVEQAEILIVKQAWDEVRQLLGEIESDVIEKRGSYKAYHARTQSYFIDRKLVKTRLTPDEIDYGFSACNNLETLGTPDADSNYVPALVRCELQPLVDHPDQGGAVVEYSKFRPDSSWGWSASFGRGNSRSIGLRNVFTLGYHYLERRPFSGDRIGQVAERHLQWGGSPLLAAFLYELMAVVDPDEYEANNSRRHLQALSTFGANKNYYETNYSKSSSVYASERYIGWYKSSRLKAQGLDNDVRLLKDNSRPTVTITRPDGRVESKVYDAISGRLVKWQIGSAWVSADFGGATDQVTRIASSNGEWVALEYRGQQISRMNSSSANQMEFEYNANNQPVNIKLKGLGTLLVTYSKDGELLHVNALQEDLRASEEDIANTITGEFNTLLELAGHFEDLGSSRELPDLPLDESDLDALREVSSTHSPDASSATEYSAKDDYESRIAVARYLIEHLSDRQTYSSEARSTLDGILAIGNTRQIGNRWARDVYATAIQLKQTLILKTRPFGVPAGELVSFLSQVETLQALANESLQDDDAIKFAAQEIEEAGLELLKASQWLPSSDLNVRGFWQYHSPKQVLPDELIEKGARIQCLHLRRDGEIFVGTTHGLCVFRKGFWQWFGVNVRQSKLDSNFAFDELKAESSILAIAETRVGDQEFLWLGSANGLHRVELSDDGQAVKTWRTESDGIATPRIAVLAQAGKNLLVGTNLGAYSISGEILRPVLGLSDDSILWARSATTTDGVHALALSSTSLDASSQIAAGELVFAGTENGVFAIDGETSRLVLDEKNVSDVAWHQHPKGQLYFLKNNQVRRVSFDGTEVLGRARLVPGHASIQKSLKINRLAQLQIDQSHAGIGVLTDLGTSIYFDGHFEHFSPAGLTSQTPTFEDLRTNGRSFVVLSDQGLLTFNREMVLGDMSGPGYSIATSESLGATFVARGNRLEIYQHDRLSAPAQVLIEGPISHVVVDDAGRVYFDRGGWIFRIDNLTESPLFLFQAIQSKVEDVEAKSPEYLTVTSDGTVWVSAGASLFRWKQGMKTAFEYSYYINPKLFPSRTSWVSRVIEGPKDRTLVICSNEKHLNKDGVALKGGVLEWDGQSFRRIKIDDEFETWFMTSYTQVTETTGIYGSTHGFGRFADGRFDSYKSRQDVSYERLLEKPDRRLWLGTDGAKFGKDAWLFGTAGGVVGWNSGQWFDPERLNWLLPADSKAKYGSRHVNDISTTSRGQIFVTTDNGLLIYDTGDSGASDFLMFNNQASHVVMSSQQEQLNQQRRILIDSYLQANPESDFARQWKTVKEIERKQAAIEKALMPSESLAQERSNREIGSSEHDQSTIETMENEREQLAIAHRGAMQSITRDYPQAIQLLQVKPLDVLSVRKTLGSREAVIQYIVTDNQLYIQLVEGDEEQLFEVEVSAEELETRCQGIAKYFALQAESSRASLTIKQQPVDLDWESELAWLYDQLLRPVIADLHDIDHVYVVTPLGPLRYLPFEALIREPGRKPRYALEDHSFSYWPDMQFASFRQVEKPAMVQFQSLVLGDPDGTLPGAKLEAQRVHSTLASEVPLLLGSDATAVNFREQAKNSSVLHLATHAMLNSTEPDKSYILFADRRITVPEVLFLDLSNSRLTVLSACETGLGVNGLECATLARAFAHAGSQSVIATLWQVNDDASEALMTSFYSRLAKTESKPSASLTDAKRYMIKHPEKSFRSPWMWSGYVSFGAR